MAAKPYVMAVKKCLQFCIEVSDAVAMTAPMQRARLEGCAEALVSGGKTVVKVDDLRVVSRTLAKDVPFDFGSVHHLPLPPIVEKAPMVVEIVFQEGVDNRFFARVKNDLEFYDGVTATHTGFQVLEWMEHGATAQISPFPFIGRNGSVTGFNSGARVCRFLNQMVGTVLSTAILTLFKPSFWCGNGWLPGPFQSSPAREAAAKGTRVCRRFNRIPVDVSHREIISLTDGIKRALGLRYFAVTVSPTREKWTHTHTHTTHHNSKTLLVQVNFAPGVAVALVRTKEELATQEGRLGRLTMPPANGGPPPAMDSMHAAGIFNCIFYNNYGRHNPKISGSADDFLWDWMGIYDTFCTFSHSIQVNGRKIVRWCAHPAEWAKIEKTGLLGKLGEGTDFHSVPFYGESEKQTRTARGTVACEPTACAQRELESMSSETTTHANAAQCSRCAASRPPALRPESRV